MTVHAADREETPAPAETLGGAETLSRKETPVHAGTLGGAETLARRWQSASASQALGSGRRFYQPANAGTWQAPRSELPSCGAGKAGAEVWGERERTETETGLLRNKWNVCRSSAIDEH